jgi:hypothetical protein
MENLTLNNQDDDPAAAAAAADVSSATLLLLMYHQPHRDTSGIDLRMHRSALGLGRRPGTIPSTRATKFEFRDDTDGGYEQCGVASAVFFTSTSALWFKTSTAPR